MDKLKAELCAWLDRQSITGENIGNIRRSCFMPFASEWNAIVRDETAAREKPCPACGGEGGIDSGGFTPWGASINVSCPVCSPHGKQTELAMLTIANWLISGRYRTLMHTHSGFYLAKDDASRPHNVWTAESLVDLVKMMQNPRQE